jgi:hypothetical protein
MSYASSAIDLEEVRNKISNWSNEQSGSTKNYPSINAMEEYVNNQVNSTLKEVISDETIDFICGRLSGWQEDNDIITDENNSVLLFTNY